jgi:hypothetical protein
MRPKLLPWLLTASLLFNAAFVAGALIAWTPAPAVARPTVDVGDLLGLDAAQRQTLATATRDHRDGAQQARQVRFLATRTVIRDLRSPRATVEDLRCGLKAMRTAWQQESDHLQAWEAALIGVLDASQREALAAQLEFRTYQGRTWRILRERFDVDGDGRLSPGEQEAAEMALRGSAPASP